MTAKKPFEIARETLKQITARKMAPTPINYQAIYNEVAGVISEPPFPADRLRDIALALPTKTPGQQKQRGLLDSAIGQLNCDGVKSALMPYGGFSPPATEAAPAGPLGGAATPSATVSTDVSAAPLTA